MEGSQSERYEELGIEMSLSRSYHYPIVCRGLSCILRGAYSKLPKHLQSLIFNHTLTAFRLLPRMQTQSAIAAANVLSQSADAVFPKQKKVLAAKEFKQAKVSLKRRSKDRQGEGLPQLPQDVIVHIFGFLDLRSLLSAASVCWAWNSAASDNHLWYMLYTICFGDHDYSLEGREQQAGGTLDNNQRMRMHGQTNPGTNTEWRLLFKDKCKGSYRRKFVFDRGYCQHCDAIVWPRKMNCPNKRCGTKSKNQQLKPIFPEQLVEYLLYGARSIMSSSESDSDSDDGTLSKLWFVCRFPDQ